MDSRLYLGLTPTNLFEYLGRLLRCVVVLDYAGAVTRKTFFFSWRLIPSVTFSAAPPTILYVMAE